MKNKVIDALSALEPLITEAQKTIDKLSSYMEEVDNLQGLGQVLEDRVEGIRRQMDDMYETIALGLTAEALSHEVFNVADQLARRAKSAQTKLANENITNRTVLTFIEHVHSAVMALRKQMSFLSPSLRYVREQREVINTYDFLKDMSIFYHDRLAKQDISIDVQLTTADAFSIKMNKGKLIQIIDNFVINSEYWLKEDIAQKRLKNGVIIFEVKRPFIYIYDNGRGIDPTVESALFEPFITAKAKGYGRGLGLFIVKQLLDSESCTTGLLPERNKSKRFYKFQIDLRGAIHD